MTHAQQHSFDNLAPLETPFQRADWFSGLSNERHKLFARYADRIFVNPVLSRSLVSFQANKSEPYHRWFKYREGFSEELVSHFLDDFVPLRGAKPKILDPFAGAGTTLTTASRKGWAAVGIELMPVGAAAIRARKMAETVDVDAFGREIEAWKSFVPADTAGHSAQDLFPHVPITEKAFTVETERAIADYLAYAAQIQNRQVRYLFWFACFSILEDVSFTRKDGQYLRWDNRSGRDLRAQFDKGLVLPFKPAVISKLRTMLEDLRLRTKRKKTGSIKVIQGSCLLELPKMEDGQFDFVMTSPPYCNRYDYTRTYALELAFMRLDNAAIKQLRQDLLSATVENKSKRDWLSKAYQEWGREDQFLAVETVFNRQWALQEVLTLLKTGRDNQLLNNPHIPNLVENYFLEMCLVVHELARVLAPGGRVVMVNDNVQYMGEEVPVDLILSSFAESAGLCVDRIWVLPKGKGNSSQQMGLHGRTEQRKCVYVWSKPDSITLS